MAKDLTIVGNDYSICITDCHEVYGHDDSLPFNANVTIYKGCSKYLEFKAWNDGWGGPTELNIPYNDIQKEKELDVWCNANFSLRYVKDNFVFKTKLCDLIEHIACFIIDGDLCGYITISEFIKFYNNYNKDSGFEICCIEY